MSHALLLETIAEGPVAFMGLVGATAPIYMVRDTIRVRQAVTPFTFRLRDLVSRAFGVVCLLAVPGNQGPGKWLPGGGIYLITAWSCLGMAAIAFVRLIFSRQLQVACR